MTFLIVLVKDLVAGLLTWVAERFLRHSKVHKVLTDSHGDWVARAVAAENEVVIAQAKLRTLGTEFNKLIADSQKHGLQQAAAYVRLKQQRDADANNATKIQMKLTDEVARLKQRIKKLGKRTRLKQRIKKLGKRTS